MPSRYPAYKVSFGDDIGDPNYLDGRFRDIDLRLVALEDIEKDWTAALASVTELGLARINEVMRPAYDEISRLAHLGAIFLGHSSSELLLETGLHRFTITADERDVYAPAAYVAAFSSGDASKALLGRVLGYDRASGELDVQVDKIAGAGSASDWVIYPSPSSATADDRAAIEALKDVILGYRTQCEAFRQSTSDDAVAASAARQSAVDANAAAQAASAAVQSARDQTIAAIAAWDVSVLGAFTVAPATRAGALPLQVGDQYFDANEGVMKWKTWDGSQWTVNAVPMGSQVGSVFGRTGTVAAQSGDYRGDQIGRTAGQQAGLAGATVEDALVALKGRDDAEATARANADATKADRSVQITGAGLATGGGDLSASRTITVTEASQAEAQAGTAANVVMTPRRTADAIAQLVPAASTSTPGKVQLATTQEGQAGTSTTKVTPVSIVKAMIDAAIAALMASSPAALDTMSELAAAIGNDANFSATVTNLIGQKLSASAVSPFMMTVLDDIDPATARGTLGAAALSHAHAISDIANLQATLDTKLAASAYTAADVLVKIKTVDGNGSGLDADLVRGTAPTTFGLARLADADATAARSGLGLGSAAVYAAAAFQPALGYTPVNAAGQNLAAGFTATSYPAGVQGAGGTFTPNPLNGNVQHAVNGGAHTLAAPASPCTIVVEYANNTSAGAITPSGFTKISGAFDAGNGNKFIALIVKTNSYALLQITALQ
ncbi:MAG: hypothetical protein U1E81_17625 [Xanthobacteraceae bacterium]